MMKKSSIAVARVVKQTVQQQQKAAYTTQRMIENAFGGSASESDEIHPYTGLDMSKFSQREKPSAAFEQNVRKGTELDSELKDLTDGNIVRRTLYNKLTADDFKDVDFKNPRVLAEWANRFARDGPQEYVYERSLLKPEPVTVTVTGAAGSIAYSLLPRIACGEMFGPNQPVIIKLLEVPAAEKALQGIVMELQDLASPLVTKIVATTDAKEAFTDSDYAILVGAKPRGPGMERGDLLKENAKIFAEQGQAINKYASKDVLVLVVGNPANTNALIVSQFARDIPRQNFSALTRLDHDRGLAVLSKKFDCQTGDIKRFAVWGNHSSTMFPDINHATVQGEWVRRLLGPKADEWISKEFIPTVAKRGAAIIDSRGKSSAASAADAVVKHMFDWVNGSPDWTSMAIYSEGTYGLPNGYFISMPVVCLGMGEVGVVEGLPITVESARRINASCAELIQEKAAVEALLPSPDYRFYTLDKSQIYTPRYFLENAEERVAKFENLAKESYKSLSTAV